MARPNSAARNTPEAPPAVGDTRGGVVHIRDALVVNRKRRDIYGGMSNGKSVPLSKALMRFERMSLPAMWMMDKMAAGFNRRGIGIVANDYFSMHHIPNPEIPARCQRVATREELGEVRRELAHRRNQMLNASRKKSWNELANLTHEALTWVETYQTEHQTGYPLTCHFLESLGVVAVRAPEYARASSGKTEGLSRLMAFSHLTTLSWMRNLDEKGQPIFAMGVGIFQNDVPAIPFHDEYEKARG